MKFLPGQKVTCVRATGPWEAQLEDRGLYSVEGYEEWSGDFGVSQMLRVADAKGVPVPGTYHESRFELAAESYLASLRSGT